MNQGATMMNASAIALKSHAGLSQRPERSLIESASDCKARDHEHDRAFDQHAAAIASQSTKVAASGALKVGVVAHRIDAGERSHGRDDRGREHGIRLGEPRLDAEKNGGATSAPRP